MRSGAELSRLLKFSLPTFPCIDRFIHLPEIPFSEIPVASAAESLCWSSKASRLL